METANRAAVRRPELVTDHELAPASEAARVLTVLAVYELSEAGRKASLLAGGDGHALQQLKVQVPTSRLHLVTVDAHGIARLKLRPRFELDAEHQVVRIDTAPTYDAPPSLDDLFREAARNHELERAYQAERNAARAKRREAERGRRDEIAKAFMADKSQRAIVHPAPSSRRCTLATPQGRVTFDIASDEGVSRDMPAEAHRRFRADQAAKRERNLRERAAQLALHEEKKRFIAEWIEKHGTPEQQERQAAGMLPIRDAIEAISEKAFANLAAFPIYRRDGLECLRNHIRRYGEQSHSLIGNADLVVDSAPATSANADQWKLLRHLRAALPEATVSLRRHVLRPRAAREVPPLVLYSAVVTLVVGPLSLRRDYDADQVETDGTRSTTPARSERSAEVRE